MAGVRDGPRGATGGPGPRRHHGRGAPGHADAHRGPCAESDALPTGLKLAMLGLGFLGVLVGLAVASHGVRVHDDPVDRFIG